tara:strand:+ start:12671 stop:13177 length:507 start_codon:yes stop_codon:yes gene_type:complete
MAVIAPLSGAQLRADPELGDSLLALNNAHARELSWLEPERLTDLVDMAFAARHVGTAEALLLAFDQNAAYDSANFLWLRERYDRFVYIDRVVVAASARGRGLASALYADLIDAARAAGHQRLVCEINADPPNPASDAFHARLGFATIGTAQLSDGKTVRYCGRDLSTT